MLEIVVGAWQALHIVGGEEARPVALGHGQEVLERGSVSPDEPVSRHGGDQTRHAAANGRRVLTILVAQDSCDTVYPPVGSLQSWPRACAVAERGGQQDSESLPLR